MTNIKITIIKTDKHNNHHQMMKTKTISTIISIMTKTRTKMNFKNSMDPLSPIMIIKTITKIIQHPLN